MRRLSLLVTAILASLTALTLLGAQPAMADMDEAFWVDCTHAYAEWTWSDPALNISPTAHTLAKPAGTDTYIFACRTGAHDVRMNFSSQPWPWGGCGAVAIDYLSVWVDGVKVVDTREVGEMPACQHKNAPVPVKIIVNDQLRMTICEADFNAEDATPACKLASLDLSGRPRDRGHTGKIVRTSPALLLRDDLVPPLCRALTADANLNVKGSDDGIYRKHHARDVSVDDASADPQSFTMDADNDGVADTLTVLKSLAGPQFTWRSGRTGKTAAIDTDLLGYENTNYFDKDISDFLGFVRISGKIYLYEGDMAMIGNAPEVSTAQVDAIMGADPRLKHSPTHRLFALKPDGRAQLVCSWTPRPRPEEYL